MEAPKAKESNNNSMKDNLIFKYALNKLVTLCTKYNFDSNNCSGDGPCSIYGTIKEINDGFILFKYYDRLDEIYDPYYVREEKKKDYYYLININNIISINFDKNPSK